MTLRVILIGIGVLIVVAVYLAAAARRRRDSRHSFERRFTRVNIPDVILDHDEEDRDDEETDAFERNPPPPRREGTLKETPSLPGNVVLPPEEISLDDLPRVRNDMDDADHDEPTNARRDNDQLDMFGAAGGSEDAGEGRGKARVAKRAPKADAGPPDDGLITLFVRAHEGRQFGGPELVRALNAVGMIHGEMGIFHHFGAGELRCETALFSAANMFEPGSFDLGRIEALRTSGVVLIMQLPTGLEAQVAFELLLNTAQRLAELSGGELFATPKTPLDAKNIARLRQRVARFDDARR